MAKAIEIILVHGTWGRGIFRLDEIAAWCKPDSEFVERLTLLLADAGVAANVSVFNWTGANSIVERSDAADQLAERLSNVGDVPSFVIGHSHGGNVALLGINRASNPFRHHLVTLATPFLRIIPAVKNTFQFEAVLKMLFSFSAAFLAWYVCWRLSFKIEMSFGFVLSGLAACIISFYLGWKLGVAVFRLVLNPSPHPISKATEFQLKPQRLAKDSAYDAVSLGSRLLIVRGVDDEAALTLAFGAIANRLAWAVHRFIFSFVIVVAGITAPILSYAFPKPEPYKRWDCSVVSNGFCKDLGPPPPVIDTTFTVGEYAMIFYTGTMLLGAFVLFLPSIFRLVFGREMIVGTGQCDVAADAVPDITGGATVHTISETHVKRKLIHSIYDSERCPEVVAEWISVVIRQGCEMRREPGGT